MTFPGDFRICLELINDGKFIWYHVAILIKGYCIYYVKPNEIQ